MSRIAIGRLGATMLLLVAVIPVVGQSNSPIQRTVAFEKFSAHAGIIFSGRVLRVERAHASDSQTATVKVMFRVEEALRGCVAEETIEISEWAGLWGTGDRYRLGERVLMFLHQRSEAGLTSPVAGGLGKVAVGPRGELRFTPQQARFLASQSNEGSQSGARPTHGERDNQKARVRLRNEVAASLAGNSE
jgi:hypothetical protein